MSEMFPIRRAKNFLVLLLQSLKFTDLYRKDEGKRGNAVLAS